MDEAMNDLDADSTTVAVAPLGGLILRFSSIDCAAGIKERVRSGAHPTAFDMLRARA